MQFHSCQARGSFNCCQISAIYTVRSSYNNLCFLNKGVGPFVYMSSQSSLEYTFVLILASLLVGKPLL